MRVSYEWLKTMVDVPEDPQDLVAEYVRTGTEVEAVEKVGANLDHVYTAQVVSKKPHPDSDHMDYKVTHLSAGGRIPLPRYDEFWDDYIRGRGCASDLVLGAWCHLVCDHVYNAHTRAFIKSIGVSSSDETRIRKQDDFALFGRTLAISMKPELTPGLVRACASFPQYAIDERDTAAAVDVACGVVDENQRGLISGTPTYSLLTEGLFSQAREDANAICLSGLRSYAVHMMPSE